MPEKIETKSHEDMMENKMEKKKTNQTLVQLISKKLPLDTVNYEFLTEHKIDLFDPNEDTQNEEEFSHLHSTDLFERLKNSEMSKLYPFLFQNLYVPFYKPKESIEKDTKIDQEPKLEICENKNEKNNQLYKGEENRIQVNESEDKEEKGNGEKIQENKSNNNDGEENREEKIENKNKNEENKTQEVKIEDKNDEENEEKGNRENNEENKSDGKIENKTEEIKSEEEKSKENTGEEKDSKENGGEEQKIENKGEEEKKGEEQKIEKIKEDEKNNIEDKEEERAKMIKKNLKCWLTKKKFLKALKRKKIAKELHETEKTYVDGLNRLIDKFYVSMTNSNLSSEIKQHLTSEAIKVIFGNVQMLLILNGEFLKLTEELCKFWYENPAMGLLFLKMDNIVGVYKIYVANYPKAQEMVKKLKEIPVVKNFLKELANQNNKEDITSLLLSPIQVNRKQFLFLKIIFLTINTFLKREYQDIFF